MAKEKKNKMLHFRLSEKEAETLEKIAVETGQTKSDVVRMLFAYFKIVEGQVMLKTIDEIKADTGWIDKKQIEDIKQELKKGSDQLNQLTLRFNVLHLETHGFEDKGKEQEILEFIQGANEELHQLAIATGKIRTKAVELLDKTNVKDQQKKKRGILQCSRLPRNCNDTTGAKNKQFFGFFACWWGYCSFLPFMAENMLKWGSILSIKTAFDSCKDLRVVATARKLRKQVFCLGFLQGLKGV